MKPSAMRRDDRTPSSVADADLVAYFRAYPKCGKFTRRMVINIGDFIGVSPRHVVQRLEALGEIKQGSWDWFVDNGGITRAHIDQVRRERAEEDGAPV